MFDVEACLNRQQNGYVISMAPGYIRIEFCFLAEDSLPILGTYVNRWGMILRERSRVTSPELGDFHWRLISHARLSVGMNNKQLATPKDCSILEA